MDEIYKIPDFEIYYGLVSLFRAVNADEFYSIVQSKQFSLPPNKSTNVKYFGVDYDETVKFANLIQFIDIVAVVEVGVPHNILLKIGDFTHVDTFLFKKGTVIIQSEHLDEFNSNIKYVKHRF
jgi:hypothetical protein